MAVHSASSAIISIGEALIDWVCLDRTLDLQQTGAFLKAPGGAPANVAVGLARLGCPVRFLGGFSPDIFGDLLRETLSGFGVDTALSPTIAGTNTRHAYVLTEPSGNRVFKGFTLAACADAMLTPERMDESALSRAAVVYWGSVVQSSEPSASAVLAYLDKASEYTLKVYDPNYRAAFWASPELAKAAMLESFRRAHVVKLSDDEVLLLSGSTDYVSVARQLIADYDLRLLVITLGEQGSLFVTPQFNGQVAPFRVASVEMTGAGDGFVAGLIRGLYSLLPDAPSPEAMLDALSAEQLTHLLTEANAVGALATTRPGAMSSLPTLAELRDFLASATANHP
jgi:sugar/nucleoside kinase (ribokinase family)